MDSKYLTIREAFGHIRQCLKDHGIDSDLATKEEIENAVVTLAGKSYINGYMDHVAVKWQTDDAAKDGES